MIGASTGQPVPPRGELTGEVEPRVAAQTEQVLPLHVEEVAVSRRKVATATVRVATVTRSRDQAVDEELARDRVEIERVPIGRFVDVAPPVREEGDVTIMPVVEEVVVVERRLRLKEEVRIRRVRETHRHVESVAVREQDAVITRTPAGEQPVDGSAAALPQPNT